MKSRILAIESSSPRLSLAVGSDTGVLGHYQGPLQWRHAETLFEGIQRLLLQQRWSVQSLTGILVSTGPGSFTGIRIGLAVARAIGQTLRIPVIGVSSLEILAYGGAQKGQFICPVIDALRGEVFTALYVQTPTRDLKTIWKPIRLPIETLGKRLIKTISGPLCVVGDPRTSILELWEKGSGPRKFGVSRVFVYPQANTLLNIAELRLRTAGPTAYRTVLPLYLRAAAAQERRGKG